MTATITIHGGLTAEPELRFTQAGKPVCSGTIASTDRYRDRETGEWRDGKKLYVRWTAWDQLAENIAASRLAKGEQVVITGRLFTREYTDRDGHNRTSTELEVIDFAASLRRATAQVARVEARGGVATASAGAGTGEWPSTPPGGGQAGAQPDSEPWSTTGGFGDDTPF